MTKMQPFSDFSLKQTTTFSYLNVKTNPIYLIDIVVSCTNVLFTFQFDIMLQATQYYRCNN